MYRSTPYQVLYTVYYFYHIMIWFNNHLERA